MLFSWHLEARDQQDFLTACGCIQKSWRRVRQKFAYRNVVQVNLKSCKFKKETYRDGIKRKADNIGMEYMKHG